jgi:probable HAF family extracellular repeat protein
VKTTLLCGAVAFALMACPAHSQSGFLYHDGTFNIGIGTIAFGINNSGDIVGALGNPYQYGFLYSKGVYTTISVPGSTQTWATGINDQGQIVGSYNTGHGFNGFLYSNGIYTKISVPSAPDDTYVYGINNSRQIVGTYNTGSTGMFGFIYDKGTFTTLSDPLAAPAVPQTAASGINNSGQVVGGFRSADGTADYGFLYSNGTYTTLSAPGASYTFAPGINDRHQIVGSAGNSSFLYSDGNYTAFSYPGLGTQALGINNSEHIVGAIGVSFSSGVPEPATWAMMLIGFVGLTVAFRARGRPLTIS